MNVVHAAQRPSICPSSAIFIPAPQRIVPVEIYLYTVPLSTFPYDRSLSMKNSLRCCVRQHAHLGWRACPRWPAARVVQSGAVTLTNHETGDPSHKTGVFGGDANIHATELSGSVAALKLTTLCCRLRYAKTFHVCWTRARSTSYRE